MRKASLKELPIKGNGEAAYGVIPPFAHFSLLAARHMHVYGTTPEQLASVAVTARQWVVVINAFVDALLGFAIALNEDRTNCSPMLVQNTVRTKEQYPYTSRHWAISSNQVARLLAESGVQAGSMVAVGLQA